MKMDGRAAEHFGRQELQQLLGLRTAVEPDGADARITLHTSDGAIKLSVSFAHVSALHSEIRHAALLMLYRQTRPAAQSSDPLELLFSTALRPADVRVFVEPATSDRLFVQEFRDRAPIVTRMSPDDVNRALGRLTAVARATAQ